MSCRWNNPGSHLKDLLTWDLDTAVSRLRLLLGQLLSQDFQFLHQISLVLGHRETFRVLGEISGRYDRLSLLLQLYGTTGEKRNGVLKRDEPTCTQTLWPDPIFTPMPEQRRPFSANSQVPVTPAPDKKKDLPNTRNEDTSSFHKLQHGPELI